MPLKARIRAVSYTHLDVYKRQGQNHAEIAFVVHPAWRRIGLGSALLRVLADAARARGIRQLTALCLQENRAMTEMLVRFGFELPQTSAGIATAIKIL